MGSQRYLIERLTRLGIPDENLYENFVFPIERLKRIGDEVSEALWPWEEGEGDFVQTYDRICRLLDDARRDIDKIAENLPERTYR